MPHAEPNVGLADYSEIGSAKPTSPTMNDRNRRPQGTADFSVCGHFLPVIYQSSKLWLSLCV
jgi:hypothetical protein